MSSNVKVIAVSRGKDPPQQFGLAPGEVLVVGRGLESDVVVGLHGVSARHLELCLAPPQEDSGKDAAPALVVQDASTNGTGVIAAPGQPWTQLRRGESRAVQAPAQILVPLLRKLEDPYALLCVRVLGDTLPDAYDQRRCKGRWLYRRKLGEGALGVVYQASDTTGRLKQEVAIKISKVAKAAKPSARARNAYILHREAQWSLQKLHNEASPGYCAERAALFARYIEDHTGSWALADTDFDGERATYESPDFGWDQLGPSPPLPACPYVVMELIPGRTLHGAMGWSNHDVAEEPALDSGEKLAIVEQSARALEYMASFGLIHRDFRTMNLLLCGRDTVRVIDLGHTISAEERQARNRSAIVKCSWRESKGKLFDWAPMEVKDNDLALNFLLPVHAFDVFSLAVLILQLDSGSLQAAHIAAKAVASKDPDMLLGDPLGIKEEFLRRMLGEAAQRPCPGEVLQALQVARQSRRGSGGSRSRSPYRNRRTLAPFCMPEDMEVVDDGCVDGSGVAYGSETAPSGSDTEPE